MLRPPDAQGASINWLVPGILAQSAVFGASPTAYGLIDGIAATRELSRAAPAARVLILTTFEQDEYIVGALRAGASGFLLKRTRPEELIAAMHTIAAGDSLLSPSVTPARDRPHGPAAHVRARQSGQAGSAHSA